MVVPLHERWTFNESDNTCLGLGEGQDQPTLLAAYRRVSGEPRKSIRTRLLKCSGGHRVKELYVAPSEKDVLLSSGAPYQLMAFGIFASMVLSFQGGILEWILGFSLVALVLQALWFFRT